MYQNANYICISWYSNKFDDSWWKNADEWNSRDMSHDLHIFWIFLGKDNFAKFHHCRICVTDFKDGGALLPPPPPLIPSVSSPKKDSSWIESRALIKEPFTLKLKILQILNLKPLKNCSFTKIDDCTN